MPNNCDGKNFREIVDKIRTVIPQLAKNKKVFFYKLFVCWRVRKVAEIKNEEKLFWC